MVQRSNQRLQVGQWEVCRGGLYAFGVVFRGVRRAIPAIVTHEKRAAIDVEVRTQLTHGSLVDLVTVERTTNCLRDTMAHRFALRLLAQRFFRAPALGYVNADTGDVTPAG